jgi:hypothetical protein
MKTYKAVEVASPGKLRMGKGRYANRGWAKSGCKWMQQGFVILMLWR